MILCRLRTRIGVYLSGLLLLVGAALTMQATETITRSQAQAMMDGRLAAAGVLVFGAFWVLLLTISGRSEKALLGSIQRLEAAVADFKRLLDTHDGSEYAHTAASEHNHKPLEAKIDATKKDLDNFIDWCRTHQCVGIPRDPTASPHPRRSDDPPMFDGTDRRGKR